MHATVSRGGYKLLSTVELVPTSAGGEGVVFSRDPLRVIKVNASAFELLERCRDDRWGDQPGREGPTNSFLDAMTRIGILTWEPSKMAPAPLVSVVIPVFNRARELTTCINSLKALDYPRDKLEIIVVDDGSDDDSFRVAAASKVKVIRLPQNRGQSAARNEGVRHCRGQIIAFIDSDCIADRSWLKDLTPYFEDGHYALVGGYVDSFYNEKPFGRYEEVCSPLNMGKKGVEGYGSNSVFYVPTCNMLVDREAFNQAGGFDERLRYGEDVDLCWKLLGQGNRLLYLPRGTVAHRHRSSLPQLVVQRFNYGTSESLLYDRHRHVRKHFPLRPTQVLFLAVFIGGLFTWSLPLLTALILLIESGCAVKFRRLRTKMQLNIDYVDVRKASYKSCYALAHHFLHHLLRYYLWPLVLLSFLFRPVLNLLLAAVVLPTATIYVTRRPRIAFPWFAALFLVDQVSYQSGVIWGCVRSGSFRLYRISFTKRTKSETHPSCVMGEGRC